jgi:hypothetical protein
MNKIDKIIAVPMLMLTLFGVISCGSIKGKEAQNEEKAMFVRK